MKVLSWISIFCLLNTNQTFAQHDSTIIKHQEGYLFLSGYHFLYDWKGGHIRPEGFRDLFFPGKVEDLKTRIRNGHLTFKSGIRVDHIPGRYGLKKEADTLVCVDTTGCYRYRQFYLVPVIMDYSTYDDNYNGICDQNLFEIKTSKGYTLQFESSRRALVPLNIPLKVQTIKPSRRQ